MGGWKGLGVIAIVVFIFMQIVSVSPISALEHTSTHGDMMNIWVIWEEQTPREKPRVNPGPSAQ